MKKVILIIVLALSCVFIHEEADAQAHYKGMITLNPAFGLGTYGYFGGGFGIPVVFYADFAVHDYVDVGPFAGLILNNSFLNFNFGARVNFNFWQLIADNVDSGLAADVVDWYISAFFGYELGDFPARWRGGGMMGVKWWFSDRIGLMAEVGGGPVSYSEIGISIRAK